MTTQRLAACQWSLKLAHTEVTAASASTRTSTVPELRPSGKSSSTPTHVPLEKSTGPTKRTTPVFLPLRATATRVPTAGMVPGKGDGAVAGRLVCTDAVLAVLLQEQTTQRMAE